jgi:hypothetical protein
MSFDNIVLKQRRQKGKNSQPFDSVNSSEDSFDGLLQLQGENETTHPTKCSSQESEHKDEFI